ncbi:MAG: hypothetical protein DDT37_01560 [Firmicutes bacterium]|nr:hypothetical protein [candidate division NPL-UPA2 bacterium]
METRFAKIAECECCCEEPDALIGHVRVCEKQAQ